MPDFTSKRTAKQITRLLYLGHTGAGKTGSLCSLAAAGYNVRILDLDDGTEIIDDFVSNSDSPYRKSSPMGLWTADQTKDVASRISYVTITESYKLTGARAVPKGDSWKKISDQLNDWKDGEVRLGNIASWGPQDILVIDGLSRLCESAMNFQLAMNGRLISGPQVGTSGSNDYTQAYNMILSFLDLLKCGDIKCSVIMICHIALLERGDGASKEIKGFPQTVGRAISPKIGQYFNHALMAKSVGEGQATRRMIVTNNADLVELKTTIPLRVKKEYPLSTGLAEYFKLLREQLPVTSSGPDNQPAVTAKVA